MVQQRGVAVPFETPALRGAKVCEDERDGLVALLRDFANDGLIYIMPWSQLPSLADMTQADAALHRAVEQTRAVTPAAIAAAVRIVALSGLLGANAKADAIARDRAETQLLSEIKAILILHLLNVGGADLSGMMANPARPSLPGTRNAVAAAASKLGISRQEIYRRADELATVLRPVGLAALGGPVTRGWLRILQLEVHGLQQDLASRAEQSVPELAGDLNAIAAAAGETADLAGAVLATIDRMVLDIGALIRRWERDLPVLQQAIDRLSWVLDEWPQLIRAAREVLASPPEAMARELTVLRCLLPRRSVPMPSPANAGAAPSSRISRLWSRRGAR